MSKPSILLSTVGTSLFRPNLLGLDRMIQDQAVPDYLTAHVEELNQCVKAKEWQKVAKILYQLDASARICGAEINSITSLLEHDYAVADCGVFFFHSATDDGRAIAAILQAYYRLKGHSPCEVVEIEDLQDSDPKRFRTHGLRNLARQICRVVRERHTSACAINATGGYKAQIAIAVLLGQALGVPVYYKHEFFSEIIAFPPMPVSLDFEYWMKVSGILYDLEKQNDMVPASEYLEELDERCESLIERVNVDGVQYLELSATGQIFHETFRNRFQSNRDEILPPPVPSKQKREPRCDHGHITKFPALKSYMQTMIDKVPQVVYGWTHYHNPALPSRKRFRISSKGIEGIWSDGKETVNFIVETSAKTEGQMVAMVAALNEWLEER